MNKKRIAILVIVVLVLGAWYFITNTQSSENSKKVDSSPQNATYLIHNEPFTLVDGLAEKESVPESSSKIVTKYFGNDVSIDLNDDGREDSVFLLTQESGGSGTFFYAVAALNTEDGWKGSHALFLGDRIAPKTTEISTNPSHKNVIVVNYAERKPGEPMSAEPSVGKSIWLKLDLQSMQFGEVAQDFEGEADPSIMTLGMHSWRWIKTSYNNDTELVPNNTRAFTVTFKDDGTFSATTDCNVMNGTYKVREKQITFGENIAMTRMFCKDSQEEDFAKLFGEIQSFFFTSRGELIFNLKFDSGSAIFR